MLSYYYYFLGELLGEINYIIIIFLEYDIRLQGVRSLKGVGLLC